MWGNVVADGKHAIAQILSYDERRVQAPIHVTHAPRLDEDNETKGYEVVPSRQVYVVFNT